MQLTDFKYFFRIRYLKKQFFRTLFCFIFVFSFSLSFATSHKELKEDRDWYERMGKQGDWGALVLLALMYLKGEGGKQNIPKAKRLLEKATEQGNEEAKYYLESINGSAEHQYLLGTLSLEDFDFDLNPVSDIILARFWFELSAEQGYLSAQIELAFMDLKGKGRKQDILKAKRLLEKMSKQGDKWAQFYLGTVYQDGLGVDPDFVLARFWLEKSAEQGHPEARAKLFVMDYEGEKENLELTKVRDQSTNESRNNKKSQKDRCLRTVKKHL